MSAHDTDLTNEWDFVANRWVWWCRTRRLFVPPVKSNVLARLQKLRTPSVEPDAFLDAAMPFFNMAVHALCDRPEYEEEVEAFVGVYWYEVNIKALAREQRCARGTVYNRSRRFARRAHALSITIRKTHEAMSLLKCSISVEQNSACDD